MNTYIIFLRAVNVSGKNIIKMADLKVALIEIGFKSVITYIQSGNVVLKSNAEKAVVEQQIKQLIQERFLLDIAVFCLDVQEVETALQNNPFPADAPNNKVFITFMKNIPSEDALHALTTAFQLGNDAFKILHKLLYFYVVDGMGASKMNTNFFEKKLQTIATGRNLNTIRKVIAYAQSI
ncbi:DUF1697 domain-containing protein [Paenimyroides aestuarii]|uniref:DUF1697 domain-containing protein n=1 Tax=Paenimyroides aestuarii TaxID=2968490 RepID=A0ABY5NP58_9FLAO|nr:DUF1697 domain-containing protein [Paenimyroides aestuarii]UUV20291.1 DUF1697 domain-containing protein [Paenimyroides aestuarii]